MPIYGKEILLTVQCGGRYAQVGRNSTSKKNRKKMAFVLKAGKTWHDPFVPGTYHEAKIANNINADTVAFWSSEDSYAETHLKPAECTFKMWKAKSNMERLLIHLQIHADFLAKCKNAKFSWKWIE